MKFSRKKREKFSKIKNDKKILKRKIQKEDEGWSIKPWYTQSFGPFKKNSNQEGRRSWEYHRLWRKALGHKVITYLAFASKSKNLFQKQESPRSRVCYWLYWKVVNQSMLWESFESLKPKDMSRLTKSPIRIKK